MSAVQIAARTKDCLGFAGLPYHRNKAARRMRDGWSRRDISLSEYGWLRGLDKSPHRPLVSLVAAESRIHA